MAPAPPLHLRLIPMTMRAIAAIRMCLRPMRAAMMPVTVEQRLVALRPAILLAIRRLLVLTVLRTARLLAPPMRELPTALVTPLPMLAPPTVLAPMLPRVVRVRAPMRQFFHREQALRR